MLHRPMEKGEVEEKKVFADVQIDASIVVLRPVRPEVAASV